MAKLVGSLVKYPARVSFAWYLVTILVGGTFLAQPVCRRPGRDPISWLDGTFTATSATCVTGLTVRSTENDFSFLGQLVVLLLIQLGGIGIITVTTFITFHLGSGESLQHRLLVSQTLGTETDADMRWILRNVVAMTFLIEGSGFVLLAIRNLFDLPPLTALWNALFHSISAFCNAGFALHDDNLIRYQGDVLVNATICSLIVIGGIGFPVILDIRRNWKLSWRQCWDRLLLHSKITLIGTCVLLSLGTASFLALEWQGVLRLVPLWQRPMIALFHSVTCRTAGYNTVDLAALTNATLLVSILLMAVGAGPCSTAGGIKVSTMMVLGGRAWCTFRGQSRLHVFRRTIPRQTIETAGALTMLYSMIAIGAVTILLVTEQSGKPHHEAEGLFMQTAFEVISAQSTVGLSVGITPHLTTIGRVIVIMLMFIGRLGPITVFAALSGPAKKQTLAYPDEEPWIG